jgi:hypothetical protein
MLRTKRTLPWLAAAVHTLRIRFQNGALFLKSLFRPNRAKSDDKTSVQP